MSITLPTPHFPRAIDSTMLVTLDACERKFYYEFILNRSPHAISTHLHAGGALAHGIEHTRRGLWQYHEPLEVALCRGTREFIHYWGDFETPTGEGVGMSTKVKTFNNVLGAMWEYFSYFNPYNDHVQPLMKNDAEPTVEFSFAIPTSIAHPETGDPILFAGRADMIGFAHGLLAIVDEKTTYSLGPMWINQWQLRSQFLGYCWAAQQYGYPIKTALIRGIGIQVKEYKFLEAFEQYPEWQIERWWEQAQEKINRAVSKFKSGEWTYSYGDACSSYGGCEYIELCTTEPQFIPNYLQGYRERNWDPTHKNPTAIKEA